MVKLLAADEHSQTFEEICIFNSAGISLLDTTEGMGLPPSVGSLYTIFQHHIIKESSILSKMKVCFVWQSWSNQSMDMFPVPCCPKLLDGGEWLWSRIFLFRARLDKYILSCFMCAHDKCLLLPQEVGRDHGCIRQSCSEFSPTCNITFVSTVLNQECQSVALGLVICHRVLPFKYFCSEEFVSIWQTAKYVTHALPYL